MVYESYEAASKVYLSYAATLFHRSIRWHAMLRVQCQPTSKQKTVMSDYRLGRSARDARQPESWVTTGWRIFHCIRPQTDLIDVSNLPILGLVVPQSTGLTSSCGGR